MYDIPLYVINQIKSAIKPSLIELAIKYYLSNQPKELHDEAFDKYLDTFIQSNGVFRDGPAVISSTYTKLIKKRQRIKKRWAGELDGVPDLRDTYLKDEYGLCDNIIATLGMDKFPDILKCSSLEEYINIIIAKIQAWASDKNSLITEFKYIDKKPKKQIMNAIELDLLLDIYSSFINEYDGDIKNCFTDRADILVNNSIFADGKAQLKLQTMLDSKSNEDVFYNDYEVTQDYIIRTIIDNTKKDSDIKLSTTTVLDERDAALLDVIMSKLRPFPSIGDPKNPFPNRVCVELRELVSAIYQSQSAWDYEEVKRRLFQLAAFQIQGLYKNPDGSIKITFSFSLLGDVYFIENANERSYVEVDIGLSLYQHYLNKQTIAIYSNQLKCFKHSLSNILIFALHKERINCFNNECSYTNTYDYLFFKMRARFRVNRKDENLELIEKSLMEFKNNNIIVKDFIRIYDTFKITFFPFTEIEIHDYNLLYRTEATRFIAGREESTY